MWWEWERWFVDVNETHTSLPAQPRRRALHPGRVCRLSIDRREFDQVCRQLAEAGVPLEADLDQAWHDFAGWRVNYDRVLLSLAALTIAPYAPWSSDRSMIERNGSRIRRHNRSGPIRGPARFDLPGAGAPLSVTAEGEGWAWTH